jgi:hypothetical protein
MIKEALRDLLLACWMMGTGDDDDDVGNRQNFSALMRGGHALWSKQNPEC